MSIRNLEDIVANPTISAKAISEKISEKTTAASRTIENDLEYMKVILRAREREKR